MYGMMRNIYSNVRSTNNKYGTMPQQYYYNVSNYYEWKAYIIIILSQTKTSF